MSYYFNAVLENVGFQDAVTKVTEELQKEGFGILNSIDMQAILKQKLDVDFKKYVILGACNPQFAYRSLQLADKIGLMLPCNVVVEEHDDGSIEVAIVNPIAAMSSINNQHVEELAIEVREKLLRVAKSLNEASFVSQS